MKIKFNPKIKEPNIALKPEKESSVFLLPSGKKQINVGIGPIKEFNRRKFIIAARKIITLAKSNKIKKISVDFSDFVLPMLKMKPEEIAETLAANFELANFEFVKYKTKPKEGWDFVETIEIGGKITTVVKYAFSSGQIIGQWVNYCRTLANTPGGEMTPQVLANETKKVLRNSRVRIRVFDKKAMKKLNMSAILGVAKGSDEKPKFIILEYFRGKKSEKPIVLVGKGVTFDTGGLNIKTEGHMSEMHMDMSGAAAVISTIALAAKLKLKKNIVGLIPAVENMPSGSSYRPGDVLKTMSGKTIEVLNTDAEGRIILADALIYAKKYNPKLVIDIATLTGAAVGALGQRASAIFTKDEKLEKLFRQLGEESGDYLWPLPLWDEYEEEIKGTFGDVANIGKTRYGGAITGAMFLYQFAKDYPWVHIDIAPRMTSIEGEHLAKGAAGAPVRLLIKLLEKV